MIQRFGTVVDRPWAGTYALRDSETGEDYSFSYVDIVTEGFRSLIVGERVRFLVEPEAADVATYVVRLDMPEVEEYY